MTEPRKPDDPDDLLVTLRLDPSAFIAAQMGAIKRVTLSFEALGHTLTRTSSLWERRQHRTGHKHYRTSKWHHRYCAHRKGRCLARRSDRRTSRGFVIQRVTEPWTTLRHKDIWDGPPGTSGGRLPSGGTVWDEHPGLSPAERARELQGGTVWMDDVRVDLGRAVAPFDPTAPMGIGRRCTCGHDEVEHLEPAGGCTACHRLGLAPMLSARVQCWGFVPR